MAFWQDPGAPMVQVRWFFTHPGARVFDGESCFRSMDGWGRPIQLNPGEVGERTYHGSYDQGRNTQGLAGTHYCGSERALRYGGVPGQDAPLAVGPDGRPIGCGLPPALGGVEGLVIPAALAAALDALGGVEGLVIPAALAAALDAPGGVVGLGEVAAHAEVLAGQLGGVVGLGEVAAHAEVLAGQLGGVVGLGEVAAHAGKLDAPGGVVGLGFVAGLSGVPILCEDDDALLAEDGAPLFVE
jgi:hypothetical protein